MPAALTTQALLRAEALTAEQVETAVSAYVSDPSTGRFAMGRDYTLDLAAAVRADRWATAVLRSGGIGAKTRRSAVRSAILRASPNPR